MSEFLIRGRILQSYSDEEDGLICSILDYFLTIRVGYISITSPNKNLSDILKPNSALSIK